ncbi:hypothetical protein F0562_015463 [Nyssa sinensis]|uniref:Uncharacterized protein n=1 Tax=Nyssa sinensis TaxID=561372 RepID=A0A5J4ZIV5_9ASTE|nr:hypothetical protein F0562_015463 [Nyssa sinensis]
MNVEDDDVYYPNHDNIPIDEHEDDNRIVDDPMVGGDPSPHQGSIRKATHSKRKRSSAARMEHQLDGWTVWLGQSRAMLHHLWLNIWVGALPRMHDCAT